MYINHNGMASNVANTLTSHYNNLATSTQRLSSGLRVNSAADDAAGLAIRELMRADISSLQQGVRNANDAISLIQTADGALGIIDEKLIRMKELAEQAATGTYDSTQRLMIESEYQAMASEITRIANATDFNNMKLLNGDLEGTHDGSKLDSTGAMKIHFGTGNDSAEDYYYIEIKEMTAQALGVGNGSTWEDVADRAVKEYTKTLTDKINNATSTELTDAQKGQLLDQVEASGEALKNALMDATNLKDIDKAYSFWTAGDVNGVDAAGNTLTDDGFLKDGKTEMAGSSTLLNEFLAAGARAENAPNIDENDYEVQSIMNKVKDAITGITDTWTDDLVDDGTGAFDGTGTGVKAEFQKLNSAIQNVLVENGISANDAKTIADALVTYDSTANPTVPNLDGAGAAGDLDVQNAVTGWAAAVQAKVDTYFDTTDANYDDTISEVVVAAVQEKASKSLETFEAGLRDTEKQKLSYMMGQAAMYNLANGDNTNADINFGMGIDDETLSFTLTDDNGAELGFVTNIRNEALQAAQTRIKDMDFAGFTIETQEDAQQALNAINDAIVQKDKTRAHLGALQNRLENTVSNLTIQAENLQSAESRISDVDVATEMTNFVRNQILTQSAVAMLGQANSMPQMAMQLIG